MDSLEDVLKFCSNPADDAKWELNDGTTIAPAVPHKFEPPTLLVYGPIEMPEPNVIRYNYCTLGEGYPWVTVTVTDGELESVMQVEPPTEKQLAEWGAGKPL